MFIICCAYSFSFGIQYIHSALVFAKRIVSSSYPVMLTIWQRHFQFGANLKNRLPVVVWLVNLVQAPLSSKDSQTGFKLICNSIILSRCITSIIADFGISL